MENSPVKKKHPLLRLLAKVALAVILFFVLILLFIRSPWGQDIIVQKVVSYVSDKTGTEISLGRLFITFSGEISLQEFYVEDLSGDSLFYSRSLEVDLPLWPIITGEDIVIDGVQWDGLRANVIREDSISGFNFDFLIDAFMTDSTQASISDSTASDPMQIILGNMEFSNFDLTYVDNVAGITSMVSLGNMQVVFDEIDPSEMYYAISSAQFTDLDLRYVQTKPFVEEDNGIPASLPFIQISELVLERITAHYDSGPDGLIADVNLGRCQIEMPKLNLEASQYEIDAFSLNESNISIKSNSTESFNLEVEDGSSKTQLPPNFEWPDIRAEISKVDFQDNVFSFSRNGAQPLDGKFDIDAIHLSDFDFIADRISVKKDVADLSTQDLSFQEASGIELKELGFKLSITDDLMDLKDLVFAMNGSSLRGSITANYPSIQKLIDEPSIVRFDLIMEDIDLDIADIYRFDHSLEEIEPLLVLSKKPVQGNLAINGSLAELHFIDNQLSWGSSTNISLDGVINQVLVEEELRFYFPKLQIITTRTDALQFIQEDALGIQIPRDLIAIAQMTGNLDQLSGEVALRSEVGNIWAKGQLDMTQKFSYEVTSIVSDLQLNKLLKDEQLGSLSMSIKSKGEGNDINSLDADLEATIKHFEFNNYVIKNLQLQGGMLDGIGNFSSLYKDDNLDATLNGIVQLDSVPTYSVNLDLVGIDMEAFGVTEKQIRAALKLEAVLTGDMEDFDLMVAIDNGIFASGQDAYRLDRLDLVAHVSPDSTSAIIKNELINLDLQSNTDPSTFSLALVDHLKSYFDSDTLVSATNADPVRIIVGGSISQSPILSEVFLDKLQDLDTVRFAVDFDEQKRVLHTEISAPHINYDGYLVDSLRFKLDTRADDFDFDFGFARVMADPILLKRTSLSGKESEGILELLFDSYDNEEQLIHIQSILKEDGQELYYSLVPEGLILNGMAWSIPLGNEIHLAENAIHIKEFVFSHEDQSIEFTDDYPGIEDEHLAVLFEHFELGDFLSYFNPDEELASGQLDGNLIVQQPFGDIGIKADLDIKELKVLSLDMGKLRLDASSEELDSYDLSLSLKEGHVDLDLEGKIAASGSSPTYDLRLDLNRMDVSALGQLAQEEIKAAKGDLNGRFTFQGDLDAPQYSGELHFDDVGFEFVRLNSAFSMPDEYLSLDNDGLRLDGFTVLDLEGNAFDLSGAILTKDLLNPRFDLKLNAQDFRILNASADENDLIYGLAVVDATGTIKGNLDVPVIDLTLTVDPTTDVTYILPSSVAEIERMDGVVVFVDKEDSDAILLQNEEVTATLSGYDVRAVLKVNKEAKVKMILDKETGDNFQVSGEAELKFGMEPNGRMTLAGVYNVSAGSYEMNLYGLVNRRFELSPESKVSWSGDPFDAKLDIRAIYRQEASCAPLMASVTSGLDPSAKSRYRQVLPFYVYLDIDGELDAPEISFALDMPKDEQGALSGKVYGRLQQVNSQEEELNKQVFSLLVLNRFYPEVGSDGSSGGVASAARDNLNDALSDQLNVFSDKLLGQTGVQLDFGLDTYTDYQGDSPTDRTQLEVAAKKSLFNDRLSVSVGSEVDIEGGGNTSDGSTPLIGKVSIEYVLTADGQYRLKGFRRNEFENVIDGQTIVSGIAMIFAQEFNDFDELWKAMLGRQSEDVEGEQE